MRYGTKLLALCAALSLALPASASAFTPTFNRFIHASQLPLAPVVRMDFDIKQCGGPPDPLACASPESMTIHLGMTHRWWRDRTNPEAEKDFLHECGHLYDFQVLTQAQRDKFTQIINRPYDDWWPRSAYSADDPPNDEVFAETYGVLADQFWRRNFAFVRREGEQSIYEVRYAALRIRLTGAQLYAIRVLLTGRQ